MVEDSLDFHKSDEAVNDANHDLHIRRKEVQICQAQSILYIGLFL